MLKTRGQQVAHPTHEMVGWKAHPISTCGAFGGLANTLRIFNPLFSNSFRYTIIGFLFSSFQAA